MIKINVLNYRYSHYDVNRSALAMKAIIAPFLRSCAHIYLTSAISRVSIVLLIRTHVIDVASDLNVFQ